KVASFAHRCCTLSMAVASPNRQPAYSSSLPPPGLFESVSLISSRLNARALCNLCSTLGRKRLSFVPIGGEEVLVLVLTAAVSPHPENAALCFLLAGRGSEVDGIRQGKAQSMNACRRDSARQSCLRSQCKPPPYRRARLCDRRRDDD